MEPPKKSRHGCLWAIIILQALVLAAGVATVIGIGMVSLLFREVESPRVGVDESPELTEVWSCGAGDVKVVRIALHGMIVLGQEEGFLSSTVGSADQALRAIHRATHDSEVKALILEVDSGGGGITASDVIYKALLDFKKAQRGRKIVAVFGDVAASGAYYVSLASDCIVAHPTTITGSIGVLIQTLNLKGLGEKVGIKDVTIKSGANKDILNPFGEMTAEQRQLLQGLVDELHSRFVSLVAQGRKLPEDQVRAFADGRIFSASKAMDLGLVDQIGYWEDAMAKTSDLLGARSIKVYRYEQGFSLSAFLKSVETWDPVSNLLLSRPQTRLLYLWQP